MKFYNLHPILFSQFPILFLYLHNIDEVQLQDILLPLMVSFFLSIVTYITLNFFIKDKEKTALVTSISIFFFFSTGHILKILENTLKLSINKNTIELSGTILVCGLWTGLVYFIIKSQKISNFKVKASKVFFVISLYLTLSTFGQAVIYEIKTNRFHLKITHTPPIVLEKKSVKKPDIYYIIMDTYASNNVLKKTYKFDNSSFTNFLKQQGFVVFESAWSNYPKTCLSLASSLNMKYLDELSEKLEKNYSDRSPLFKMIENNPVIKILKNYGYNIIHIGSWWPATQRNKFADKNYNLDYGSDFVRQLLLKSILKIFLKKYSHRFDHARRVLFQFRTLCNVAKLKSPKFVFAHILLPHPPFVFDAQGNFLEKSVTNKTNSKENYIQQLKFANKLLIKAILTILSHSKESVIILQADEGPYAGIEGLENTTGGIEIEWDKLPVKSLKSHFGILLAVHLPYGKEILKELVSPVNIFRMIFRYIFKLEKLTILKNKYYIFKKFKYPYNFIEITHLNK